MYLYLLHFIINGEYSVTFVRFAVASATDPSDAGNRSGNLIIGMSDEGRKYCSECTACYLY